MAASDDRLERLRAARLHQQRRADDLDGLVRSSIGLHSTDYATPYLSAWARLADFDAAALFARLSSADGLVRVNAMRNTVHVVHADDLPTIVAATGTSVGATGRRSPGLKALSDLEIARGVERIVAALADGPLGTNELKARVPELGASLRYWLLVAMGTGEVVRADAAHPRSNRCRYARTRDRVPGFRPGEIPADEARRTLLIRAVHAFGPLTVDDLAWWLPAPKGEVKRALASADGLATIDADGRTYWFAASLEDAPAPPREAHGAWLLPYEDALLKGYLDRGWCLAPGLREVLFPHHAAHGHPAHDVPAEDAPRKGVNVSGEARPSVWWGGRAVGRWEEHEGGVAWRLHADVGAEARAAIAAATDRLGRFLATSGL